MIFTIFLGRRVCWTKAMKKVCSLEFIHTVFLTKREAIYKIPIKPCVRNLIQRCSVERIRLNKTWMTLKLTKILVSLQEWVLWKKWWGLWQSFLNWLQLMIFTIFVGRRVCCTQAMKMFCSLEFIHLVFLTREKPFTRFQSNHVREIWSSAVL